MTEPVTCDSCGRSMTDTETGSTYIGLTVQKPADAAIQRVYPELKLPLSVNICWVCYLTALGAAPDYEI